MVRNPGASLVACSLLHTPRFVQQSLARKIKRVQKRPANRLFYSETSNFVGSQWRALLPDWVVLHGCLEYAALFHRLLQWQHFSRLS